MFAPIRPRRSVLYMPGSNARALEKARSLPCDGIIIDLEDAVAPEAKAEARGQVAATLAQGGFGRREVVVRVNGAGTPWFDADLAAIAQIAAAGAGVHAVLIPKVVDPETLRVVGRQLEALGAPSSLRLWAMIETPLAVLRALDIALAARDPVARLAVLVLGTNDLAKETGAQILPGRAPMASWLSHCVLAARAGGIELLDGVWNDFGDLDGFTRECVEAAQMGYDGKTLIHPSQIAPCNDAFSPPEAEIAVARALIAVFDRPEHAGRGVLQIDGRMYERMHADIARKRVALADAIAARS
ncbi:HpcH/HpaI aldolase/citrate lyase family protein [Ancylobacter sp. SL191]|uniref:HpcH/HpaI aldolase/citrate lyase family protein n=1 Tax=Ancylobacter sp. SL191 TaxID=2995166 RepID=UPI0022712195|nr:CoA ester lyase [Ancylobacter sp. SL191]WAC28749.1 CoA ester lyase [Ancylobacter sp. SL191]